MSDPSLRPDLTRLDASSAGIAKVGYRPEIDGLRALAVIPVILFHLKLGILSGGFLGVDVFFAISGFLITSIILRECDLGVFSFKAFWLRRARRILPVLMSMVAVSVIVIRLWVFKGEHPALGFQGLSALLSFANLTMWRTMGNYWGPDAENSPFLHAWSLSVEEQFYLIFPALVFLLLKIRSNLTLVSFATLSLVSFGAFLYGARHNPFATFFFLPTRAWELGAGALLALLVRQYRSSPRSPFGFPGNSNPRFSWMGLLGLGLVMFSYFGVSTPGVSAQFLMPVLGATLIMAFASSGPAYRLLSAPPLVFTGKISYSLYIWHWPIIVFFRDSTSFPKAALLPLTVAVSIASYYCIEKPARANRRALFPIAVGFIVALCSTVWLASSSGEYDTKNFARSVWKGLFYDVRPRTDVAPEFQRIVNGVTVPEREKGWENAFASGGIIKNYGAEDPELVVLGDSHAIMWSGLIDEVAKDSGATVSFYAMNGVPPFLKIPARKEPGGRFLSSEEKYLYDTKRLELIRKWKPKLIVFVAAWSGYTMEDAYSTMCFLQDHAEHVLLIEQPPELARNNFNIAQYLCYKGISPLSGEHQFLPQFNVPRYEEGRAMLRRIASELPKVQVAPIFDLYSATGGNVWVLDGSDILYLDNNHLTEFGVSKARPRLEKLIQSLLGRSTSPVESSVSVSKR